MSHYYRAEGHRIGNWLQAFQRELKEPLLSV